MKPLNEPNVNVEQLKRLYASNKCAKALLSHAAKRKNNKSTTTVDRLLAVIVGEENTIVTRQELIEVLRKLEELGCGRFVIGRRGQSSRFEWTVQITSLGKVAIGEASVVETTNSETEEPREEEVNIVENGMITHAYQLRPDITVSLGLPIDLTTKEANRLSEFIKTLPFEDTVPN